MYLINMRPDELRNFVARELPLLIPVGVVEYHGPHLPIGTDVLMTRRLCEELERRCECVIAPAFPFGPTMNWAGGPEEGDMDFEPEPLFLYVKETLRQYAAMGFRRIYMMHHHAGPEGLQALCLKRAAAELERDWSKPAGSGWGRLPDGELREREKTIIRVAALDAFSSYSSNDAERLPLGHASKGETQFMLAACPELVQLSLLQTASSPLPAWLADSHLATQAEGEVWFQFCLQGWTKELGGNAEAEKEILQEKDDPK